MGMPIHVCMHPCLQKQNTTQYAKANAGHNQRTLSAASWNLLADMTCPDGEGVALKNLLPLNGVFGFGTVVQGSACWSECGLLRCITPAYLQRKDAAVEC